MTENHQGAAADNDKTGAEQTACDMLNEALSVVDWECETKIGTPRELGKQSHAIMADAFNLAYKENPGLASNIYINHTGKPPSPKMIQDAEKEPQGDKKVNLSNIAESMAKLAQDKQVYALLFNKNKGNAENNDWRVAAGDTAERKHKHLRQGIEALVAPTQTRESDNGLHLFHAFVAGHSAGKDLGLYLGHRAKEKQLNSLMRGAEKSHRIIEGKLHKVHGVAPNASGLDKMTTGLNGRVRDVMPGVAGMVKKVLDKASEKMRQAREPRSSNMARNAAMAASAAQKRSNDVGISM